MREVQYRVLGPFEVSNGAPIQLGGRKQTVLLANLVLRPNEIVSIDRLIEAIWDDDPPRTASHSVQIYVSELRKLLSHTADAIETKPPGYRLRADPSTIDAFRFEALRRQGGTDALRQALDLWQGDALSDFAYESFAQPHIRRLEEAKAAAIEALAEAELASGEATALPLLVDLADREPLREGTRRLLMLTLYRSGRAADALRVYRDFRRVLAEELGLEPSPGLQSVEEQILLQEPIVGAAAATASHPSEDWASARNPYKGLHAFSETDAPDYFGREALIADMASRLVSGRRLIAVVGPSGSGKSSLVRAGLLPTLGARADGRWLIAAMVPGRHPFEELEATLKRLRGGNAVDQVGTDAGLLRAMVDLLPDDDTRLLLFIDQFEELFTLTDQRGRRRFLRALSAALTEPQDRFHLVLTMRADFYDRPLVEGEFAPLFADGVLTVTPLTSAELETAAMEPARRVGVTIEPDLIAELVADMVDQPGALPLFEYTLTELFERRGGSELTLGDYHAVGGLRRALTKSAEDTFETLAPSQQGLARLVLLHLVKAEQGNQAIRRRVALAAVRKLAPDPDAVDEVLLTFGAPRLLLFDRDPVTGNPTVEVTHEALLAEWPRLREWIDERRIDLLRRDALLVSASEWAASGRDRDYLLTGSRLTSFARWREGTDVGLGEVETHFLDTSLARRADEEEAEARRQAEAERRARRGRRRTLALVAAVGLAATLLTLAAPRLLDPVLNPAPEAALAYLGIEGDPTDLFARQIFAGWDRWLTESGQKGEAVISPDEDEWLAGITRLADRGTPLILLAGFQDRFESKLLQLAEDHPGTDLAVLDPGVSAAPNMTGVVFKEHEGSFLAGVAAARRSETVRVGFVGGWDAPLIWKFEAGFEAGVHATDPDAIVETVYLSPWWDSSGFSAASRAQQEAEGLYRRGADVVFHAAGYAGYGVFEAAANLSESLRRHLWAIGVDEDQHAATSQVGSFPGLNPDQWPDHILTSMVKRLDNATYEVFARFDTGSLEPGLTSFGVAEEAVELAESGGFLEPYADDLESYRREISSGLRTVPQLPQKQVSEAYATAVAGLIGVLDPASELMIVDPAFADVGYPSDRGSAPVTPWVDSTFGPYPDGMAQLDLPLPSEGRLSAMVREGLAAEVGAALPQAQVAFTAANCPNDATFVALGPGRWDSTFTAMTAVIGIGDGADNGWYLVTLGYDTPTTLALVDWERLTDWEVAACG